MSPSAGRPAGRPAERCGDAGSAVVEALVVGTLMLLPLITLVVGVSRVQGAAFAVDAGARSAALAVAGGAGGADGAADSQGVADAAVALALADQGFDDGDAEVVLTCDDGCAAPGARVGVQVRYEVELPVPAVLGAVLPESVPLDGSATATVDRFAPGPAPGPARGPAPASGP